jgi:arsenite methyltransferase
MTTDFTDEDREKIDQGIRTKYAKASASPEGLFRYPTGRAGLEGLGYDEEILASLPARVVESFCGVGNPFTVGEIHSGDHVLDIGCGGGTDAIVASILTGPEGSVVGIDLSSEMVARARANLAETQLTNISYREAGAENLPFPDESFHVVISSGVFNLIPDKLRALREVFRVMKPAGQLMMADQVLTGYLSEDVKARIANWAG